MRGNIKTIIATIIGGNTTVRKVRKFIRDRGGKAGINNQKEMGEEDYDIRKQGGRDRQREKKIKRLF